MLFTDPVFVNAVMMYQGDNVVCKELGRLFAEMTFGNQEALSTAAFCKAANHLLDPGGEDANSQQDPLEFFMRLLNELQAKCKEPPTAECESLAQCISTRLLLDSEIRVRCQNCGRGGPANPGRRDILLSGPVSGSRMQKGIFDFEEKVRAQLRSDESDGGDDIEEYTCEECEGTQTARSFRKVISTPKVLCAMDDFALLSCICGALPHPHSGHCLWCRDRCSSALIADPGGQRRRDWW